jgi:AraC family transcriptional regulator of adaptative response / DNA-3-methyladenine glycosylase II
MRLPHGPGAVELRPLGGHVHARFRLADLRDLAAAIQRSRALLDLDSDPHSVGDALGRDAVLGRLVRDVPGRRVAGAADGAELALRAVLGQQISLRAASTLAARLAERYGEELERPFGSVTRMFPTPEALAQTSRHGVAMPVSRQRALAALSSALASDELVLDAGADRLEARRRLLTLPGVGAWTAEYVAMRALRDPDAFMPSDLGVRHALAALGQDGRPAGSRSLSERWRPYRSYAVQHLWGFLEQRERDSAVAAPSRAKRRAA